MTSLFGPLECFSHSLGKYWLYSSYSVIMHLNLALLEMQILLTLLSLESPLIVKLQRGRMLGES